MNFVATTNVQNNYVIYLCFYFITPIAPWNFDDASVQGDVGVTLILLPI